MTTKTKRTLGKRAKLFCFPVLDSAYAGMTIKDMTGLKINLFVLHTQHMKYSNFLLLLIFLVSFATSSAAFPGADDKENTAVPLELNNLAQQAEDALQKDAASRPAAVALPEGAPSDYQELSPFEKLSDEDATKLLQWFTWEELVDLSLASDRLKRLIASKFTQW